MAHGKTSPGSPIPWNDLRSTTWGNMIDAGMEFGTRRKFDPPDRVREGLDRLYLKNTTSEDLVRGRVLEIGATLLTSWTEHDEVWHTGSMPAPNGTKEIAVTLGAVAQNNIIACCAFGLCRAKVNINHAQHVYADVSSSTTLLQSKWYGRCRILDRESGTGEKWALIRIGDMFRGPIMGVAPSGITRGSSGTVNVYLGGTAASPSASETVHFTWMDGGPQNIPTNGELLFYWDEFGQKYRVWEGECDH